MDGDRSFRLVVVCATVALLGLFSSCSYTLTKRTDMYTARGYCQVSLPGVQESQWTRCPEAK